jgi:hypothetical protein
MRLLYICLIALLPGAQMLRGAEITAQRSEHGVVVRVDGNLFTEYLVRSGNKPVLWPIIGPGGAALTRAYPIEPGGTGSKDHVHHRSLWFAHGQVNGVDFWDETGRKTGTIRHAGFLKIQSGPRALIVTRNDWLAPDGAKVCEDRRTLTFGADKSARWIDFDISIKATPGPVTIGDTKEGTFAMRIADSMAVDAKQGGQIVNSRGHRDGQAWAQRAEWVDYHGPVNGHTVGIAILNHPSSFRFPTYWHVRTYGLFAANPFALREFTGDAKHDGSYTIAVGGTIRLAYRVVLHRGDEREGRIAEAFAGYSKEKKNSSPFCR